ncbi:hypothetical protein Tco_0831477 [Tanacetum coccineum]
MSIRTQAPTPFLSEEVAERVLAIPRELVQEGMNALFGMENQVKFATCTLMGTALTWWNSHARTVTNDVAYAMTWSDLKCFQEVIRHEMPRMHWICFGLYS